MSIILNLLQRSSKNPKLIYIPTHAKKKGETLPSSFAWKSNDVI